MSDTKKTVKIYSTSWCAFCHTEMQWLDKLGIPYESVDIEKDEAAQAEITAKMGRPVRGVPVTDVAGTIVEGFDRPKIQAALKQAGLTVA